MEQETNLYASRQLAEMLTLLREPLKKFVEPRMDQLQEPEWHRKYQSKARANDTLEDSEDTALYLKAVTDNAFKLFKRDLAPYARNLCSELLQIRNDSAHQSEFTPEDVYRAWDTAERLLTLISTSQAKLVAVRRLQALKRLVPDLRQELSAIYEERLRKANEELRDTQEECDTAALKWSAEKLDFQEAQRRSKSEVTKLESELGITRRELESVRVKANQLNIDLVGARERLSLFEREVLEQKDLALRWQQQIDSQAQEIGRLEVTLEKASAANTAAHQRLLALTDECQQWRELDEAASKEIDSLRLQLQSALTSIPPKYTWDRWVIAGFIAALIVTAVISVAVDRAVAGLAGADGRGVSSEVASAARTGPEPAYAFTHISGTATTLQTVAHSTTTLTPSPTPTMTPTPKPTVTPTRTATPTPTQFTYPTLAYNFDTRKGEGWELYKQDLLGTVVTWTGKVSDNGWFNTDVFVDVGQNDWQREVALELSDVNEFKHLKKGDTITFRGTISSLDVPFGFLGLKMRLKNVDILEITQPVEQAVTPKP